ncbi:Ser/Thr protein phosphatase [Pochonia chlamydosporia 170]|uniref:Ser/Thr protein phosphatase n=1 Tax=Pochonia chlamydosporia 170 TaxID=1380566 RepID=A0A179EZK3_METCM|nr:Ser/Thr protein phosphatase [Pochonia chlamydosporia 170]OAQ58616.1 Ser/Thr protein phosphatase [Pochonia chlamydosporia 170]
MSSDMVPEGHGPSEFSIQVMSDLHLETPRFLPMYESFRIEPKSPYLALLGDIGLVHDQRLFSFIESQLHQFRVVLYVFGNHEPYERDETPQQATYQDAIEQMEHFQTLVNNGSDQRKGKFVFLNRSRYDVDDSITILGCTLFSHISENQQSTASLFVSDFSNIPSWTVQQHNAAHEQDLAWLNTQVTEISQQEPHRRIVILTHYCPTLVAEAHDPEHLEDSRNVMSAFATDLCDQPCWKSSAVRVWVFGHTHHNCDYVEAGTGKRVVSNQRGYGREDIFDFDSDKVVVLSS